jgi:hypothetical protein
MSDITLIVTAHNEATVCGPTMRSAEATLAFARERGYDVETLIGLDSPTPATAAYFAPERWPGWEVTTVELRDVGRVRNHMARLASGRYVAFLDADDLLSENWLAEAAASLDRAAAEGRREIAHPELNVFFDGMRSVLVNIDQDSPLFTPYYLYVRNYYDTLAMAPREAHLELPYGDRDIPHGISREDFQFTIESMSAGWTHRVVPDTIIFKRRRENSLVMESNGRRTITRRLPQMAADRIRGLGRRR